MNTRFSPRRLTTAFTLVELLTVIAIIAILMGLLFPAIAAVKENGRKTQAKNDVMQIVTAVKAYNTEYGKYPSLTEEPPKPGDPDISVGDPAAKMKEKNNTLFNTLRSIPEGLNQNYKMNPRRVVFFEGRAVANPVQPRGGFVDKGSEDEKGIFYDPWGKQYNVVLDSNYDDRIELVQYYSDIPKDESPRVGVVAFALGKDNKLGKDGDNKLGASGETSDDVVSWK